MITKKSPNKSVDAGQAPERVFCKANRLAERYGIHSKTIFRWADAGLIHRRKINARVCLFDQAEVERFIDSCRVSST